MKRRKLSNWGAVWLLVLTALGVSALFLLVSLPELSLLLRHGATAEGVITSATGFCSGETQSLSISVRFTDQTGQAHTSSFNGCDYGFQPSFIGNTPFPGTVTIVYLPDNPTVIAPAGLLPKGALISLSSTILMGLLALILLPFWIRKRIRKLSLQNERQAYFRKLRGR